MWWNCDYPLYRALQVYPTYDYYFVLDFDAVVNVKLMGIAQAMARTGAECVTSFALNAITPTWSHAASCINLPYKNRVWVALISLFISGRAARFLLSERQRLGHVFADRPGSPWPICEGFVASALSSNNYGCIPLGELADVTQFGTEFVFLESDPGIQSPGSFAHSVLDVERFWAKFKARTFNILMGEAAYERLRACRHELLRVGRPEHGGWRITSGVGNLALDRPATQSSTSNSSRAPLRNGLDALSLDARGANCGILHEHHGFHTDIEDNPWWTVDLQSVHAIREVRLFNRAESPERARHFSIHISMDGQQWTRIYRKSDDSVFAGINDPLICRLDCPVLARHVRVELDRRDWFHLNEVEVYGTAPAA